jgi:hypothetical protein
MLERALNDRKQPNGTKVGGQQMSAGHIRPRGPGAWELKYDVDRDPKTGRRITRYKTVRGTKRDAQRELRKLLEASTKAWLPMLAK